MNKIMSAAQKGFTLIDALIVGAILAFGAATLIRNTSNEHYSGAGVAEDKAYRALDDAGLSDISFGKSSLQKCTDGETYGKQFNALNVSRSPVSGTVCMSWGKKPTIHFN